eukprot:COSAG05_NODE_2079_length_3603_cov_2.777968_5_plen_92_part_00
MRCRFKSDSCYTTEKSCPRGTKSCPGEITAITQFAKMTQGFNASGHAVWWALCDGRKDPPYFYSGPDKCPPPTRFSRATRAGSPALCGLTD